MKHDELVERAERWLRNSLHCSVVLTELKAYTVHGEIPDAVGWTSWRSVLVECKTSRSDFSADKKKVFRKPGADAIGAWRFYLTPPGLLTGLELPKGWGWYEVHPTNVRHAGGLRYRNTRQPFQPCRRSEIAMLVSALARVEHNREALRYINIPRG